MKGRVSEIVVDCLHPAKLARFWVEVLAGYAVRDYDAAEIQRLAQLGFTPDSDPVVMVDGPGPSLCFQKMPTLADGRSRVHLDIRIADRAATIQRLCELGARVVRVIEHEHTTVMEDPEGTRFCLLDL